MREVSVSCRRRLGMLDAVDAVPLLLLLLLLRHWTFWALSTSGSRQHLKCQARLQHSRRSLRRLWGSCIGRLQPICQSGRRPAICFGDRLAPSWQGGALPSPVRPGCPCFPRARLDTQVPANHRAGQPAYPR